MVSKGSLSDQHVQMLQQSAITDEVIASRAYRTITEANELRQLGFSPAQCRAPGLLIPLWTPNGEQLAVYRPDNPRVVENKRKRSPDGSHPNKVIKYEFPKGAQMRLDCPPLARAALGDPDIPLWITEGQKKADSLVSAGLCAIALLGVWNWRGTNDAGGRVLLADWNYIALNGREVRIVFDSDLVHKPEVRQALQALIAMLANKHASPAVVYLPPEPGRGKVGVDDWFYAGHTVDELEALVEAPRLAPAPAAASVRLLDEPPLEICRPLALLNGKGYAAAWLPVEVTTRETCSKNGSIIRHDPPLVSIQKRLYIIRDDGTVFGDGGNYPLERLGIEVRLPEELPAHKGWSTRGVKAYAAGARPDPRHVFTRLTQVVDTFIDFDHSLADQRTMSEFIACYVLHTYFLDAFNVTGFLWPNGERGSGKTQLLLTISELAYIGMFIIAAGTFASLRDLADYGATIAFDDAEDLTDARKTDPDKRALLLAGNRRGVTVPLKEPRPDGTWKTRYVNAFCPRLFSAIRLPDAVLASRTIIVPLIRTADSTRGNADPCEVGKWPCERDELVDDLWALGLAYLHEMPAWDEKAAGSTALVGRSFEPWRAVLAVAAWLEAHGVDDLFLRMAALSQEYQVERPELELFDLTGLAIRALCKIVNHLLNDNNDNNDNNDVNIETCSITLPTSAITNIMVNLAKKEELDIDLYEINSRRVGHILGKMRFIKIRANGPGTRQWKIRIADLIKRARSYGIDVPGSFYSHQGSKT
jgi:hypothetical protein